MIQPSRVDLVVWLHLKVGGRRVRRHRRDHVLEHLCEPVLERLRQESVCLVNDEKAEVLQREVLGRLEVVDQASGRGDEDIVL